jgi:hypothetical protein
MMYFKCIDIKNVFSLLVWGISRANIKRFFFFSFFFFFLSFVVFSLLVWGRVYHVPI